MRTAADGTFTVTDRPRTTGDTTWGFSFDGGDRLPPATYQVSLPVDR